MKVKKLSESELKKLGVESLFPEELSENGELEKVIVSESLKGKTPREIVDSLLIEKIGCSLLNDELSEYPSNSNNSYCNWGCDDGKVYKADWCGRGRIAFHATVHFSADGGPLENTSIFGPSSTSAEVKGFLIDEGGYKFEIESIEVLNIEDCNSEDEPYLEA